MNILRCMGSKFCMKFQRCPLKFHTKFWTHTPQNMHLRVFKNWRNYDISKVMASSISEAGVYSIWTVLFCCVLFCCGYIISSYCIFINYLPVFPGFLHWQWHGGNRTVSVSGEVTNKGLRQCSLSLPDALQLSKLPPPGRCSCNMKLLICKPISRINILSISNKIALSWMTYTPVKKYSESFFDTNFLQFIFCCLL